MRTSWPSALRSAQESGSKASVHSCITLLPIAELSDSSVLNALLLDWARHGLKLLLLLPGRLGPAMYHLVPYDSFEDASCWEPADMALIFSVLHPGTLNPYSVLCSNE